MVLQRGPHRPLGPVRSACQVAGIWGLGVPDGVVVGCREGGQDRRPVVSRPRVSRRDTLALGAGAVATLVIRPGLAQGEVEHHGMSGFGELKYPADFKHLAYVNPSAPKGGVFSNIG